ncbi:PREDICTED: uncharacterized protein LOC105363285 [Ceratosolen solmsi marchali]|uniref:Uncharacterized protein LOC105363285 n=1 Tax=Ceratosolen solmsi marchali TaxID=326594 RepID=A0AAJ6YJI9_9HYME|nr:PREDICTED: uncharacterized protein LOC105363285 [Ceratosolen solmsi marchali]XP_011499252.1 PREDICTED: uncharacterized protein LOC105363285 [Ceratosolen solmsi marchali]
MTTPRREFLRRPDVPRRRSARQALAMIPDSTSTNVSPVTSETNRTTRRYSMDSWTSAPSPDELVIQKRGRRRSIVWSPDIDSIKRESLFRDRTPIKSPTKHQSNIIIKGTPRKRLHLGDNDIEMVSHEKKERLLSNKQFTGNLANGLRGLSHDQLVKMIMDLVSMQEDKLVSSNDKLREIILKNMPVADIQPLREKLTCLRQNVYASLVSSNLDESDYSRAYVHLDNFQKALKEQGLNLIESQHWTAVIQYVFAAWAITKDLPEWKNQGMHSTTQKCYKNLTEFCIQALKNGTFAPTTLNLYKEKLRTMLDDFSDIKVCLHFVNGASV